MFKEVVYDDVYKFVPLKNGIDMAKVCTDDQSFCCLAEFDAAFNNGSDIFSLGRQIRRYIMHSCSVIF